MKKPSLRWVYLATVIAVVYASITIYSIFNWDLLAQICWSLITLGIVTILFSWIQQYKQDMARYSIQMQERLDD